MLACRAASLQQTPRHPDHAAGSREDAEGHLQLNCRARPVNPQAREADY